MKQKILICAITLVIAGLLITSATGMGKTITPVSTSTKKINAANITPAVRKIALDDIVTMLRKDGVGALKNLNKVPVTHDYSVIAPYAKEMKLANLDSSSISLPAQKVKNEKAVPVTFPQRTRAGLLFWNTHPAVASNGEGLMMMVNEEKWQNESDPTQNYIALAYSGSADGGESWGDSVYFIDTETDDPIADSMPSIDYYGKNGSLDVFKVTFRSAENSGDIHLLTWEVDATTILDLANVTEEHMSHYYWAFSTSGYSDLKNPVITCNYAYGPDFFGAIAMTLDKGTVNDQVHFCIVNMSTAGQAILMGWMFPAIAYTTGFDMDYDLGNTARVSFMTDKYTTGQTSPPYLPAFSWSHYLDDTTSPGSSLPGWWDPSGTWSFERPDMSFYNHTIVYALETYNQTADPAKAHSELELGNYYDDGTLQGIGWWANDVSWYDPAGTFRFPEVEHVSDKTFIMTCIFTNTTSQLSSVMFAVSMDDGVSWVGDAMYTWSGDDAVAPGYRLSTLSKGPIGAEIVMWSYAPIEYPDDDVLFIHYDFNTVTLNGYVTYVTFEPVVLPDIQIYNIDPVEGFKKTTTGNAAGYYSKVLILGFDIWTNATIRVIARNPTHYVGVVDHFFDTISHVNTIDVVVDIYYLDLKNFPMYTTHPYGTYTNSQLCGPAVLQMMLNYVNWNKTVNPTGPPLLFSNQTTLYNEAHAHNWNYNASAKYLDVDGMVWSLQNHSPKPYTTYRYNFGYDIRNTASEALADIALWIDYEAGIKPGYPTNVPATIPAYGNYSNWMAVRGIHTNRSVYPGLRPVTVFGLWVNDPSSTGIGENTYKTASEFISTYFLPMNVAGDNPRYNGKYVSITEPPLQELDLTIADAPQLLKVGIRDGDKTPIEIENELKIAAKQAIVTLATETDDQTIRTDITASRVINVEGINGPYSIVTFIPIPKIITTGSILAADPIALPAFLPVAVEADVHQVFRKANNVVAAVVIKDGAFTEASFPGNAVSFFGESKISMIRDILGAIEIAGLDLGDSFAFSGSFVQIGPNNFDAAYKGTIGDISFSVGPSGEVTLTPLES
ncbi:MAG: hypothetical protein NT038_10335 [Euryarchaeota archaeon]|nr:hypothetical protein [Euryarchaeota archaeon]